MNLYLLPLAFLICFSGLKSQNWDKLNGPFGAIIESSILTKSDNKIICASNSNKIFISNDLGVKWREISTGLIHNTMQDTKMKLIESNQGKIILYYNLRFYEWSENLESWIVITEISSNLSNISAFSISNDEKMIYALSQYEFFTIDVVTKVIKKERLANTQSQFICLGNNENFLLIVDNFFTHKLYKFHDDGTNLKKINLPYSSSEIFYDRKYNTIYLLGSRMFSSIDFGNSWNEVELDTPIIAFNNLISLSDGSLLGIDLNTTFHSIDGGQNWSKEYNVNILDILNSLGIPKIYCTIDNKLLAVFKENLYILTLTGEVKELQLPINEPTITGFWQSGDLNILCKTTNYPNYQFSPDGGLNWNKLNITKKVDPILFNDGTIEYRLSDTIFRSNDFFKTISKHKIPVYSSDGILFKNNIEQLVISSQNGCFISNDKGSNWVKIHNSYSFTHGSQIKISKQNIMYHYTYELFESNWTYFIEYSLDYGLTTYKIAIPNFLPKGALYMIDGLFLTKNNVFIWQEEIKDPINSRLVIKYSSDFGLTSEPFILEANENFLMLDEYDNIYTYKSNDKYIKVTNILSIDERIIDMSSISYYNLQVGYNGNLFAINPNSPLYRYNEIIEFPLSKIYGNVLIDTNYNCKYDSTDDISLDFQIKLTSNNNSKVIHTDSNGFFSGYVKPNLYYMELRSVSPIWQSCNFPKIIDAKPNENHEFKNLLVQSIEYCADLKASLAINRLRRCFDNNSAELIIKNYGSTSSFNSIITIILDNYLENISSNLTPDKIQNNIWTFIIPEIKEGKSIRINFQFKVSCNASLGQEHCIKYLINNPQECKRFAPSILDTPQLCLMNIGSFDPNDKIVLMNGKSQDYFNKNDTLIKYHIRFQNTGTDTAFNIRIKDKLDDNLDWSSFFPENSSHSFSYNINDSGILNIYFKDILLPDSNISEINSHGYFIYSIKPKKELIAKTVIKNFAEIYFDYNDPIITNLTSLVLKEETFTKNINKFSRGIKLDAHPNPGINNIVVEIPELWYYQELQAQLLTSNGITLRNWIVKGTKIIIDRNDLNSGMYYLKVNDNLGNSAYAIVALL